VGFSIPLEFKIAGILAAFVRDIINGVCYQRCEKTSWATKRSSKC